MDLYLEAAMPTGLNAREANNYGLSTASLEIWKTIFFADPESQEGIYLRLAIATAPGPSRHRQPRRRHGQDARHSLGPLPALQDGPQEQGTVPQF